MKPRLCLALPLALLALPGPALAHVRVMPSESPAGARVTYAIRVPNEKQADTVRVELRIPGGLQARSFTAAPGWKLTVLRDGARHPVAARWEGRLLPKEVVTFGLTATNPRSAGALSWAATQTYADGTTVEWTGEQGSRTPAAFTTVVIAPPHSHGEAHR